MGSKAKGKARNKATKRNGVANAAAAASSAAAAAAAHVSKDIQADANMGVPAPTDPPAAQPADTGAQSVEKNGTSTQSSVSATAPPDTAGKSVDVSNGPKDDAPAEPEVAADEPSHSEPEETHTGSENGASVPQAEEDTDSAVTSKPTDSEAPVSGSASSEHAPEQTTTTVPLENASEAAGAEKFEAASSEHASEASGFEAPASAPLDHASEPATAETTHAAASVSKPAPVSVPSVAVYENASTAISPKTVEPSSKAPEPQEPQEKGTAGPASDARSAAGSTSGLSEDGRNPKDPKRFDPRAGELKVEEQQNDVLKAIERENEFHEASVKAKELGKPAPANTTDDLDVGKSINETWEKETEGPQPGVLNYTTEPQDEFYKSIHNAVSEGRLRQESLEKAKIVANENIDPIANLDEEKLAPVAVQSDGPQQTPKPPQQPAISNVSSDNAEPGAQEEHAVEAHQLSDLEAPLPQSEPQDTAAQDITHEAEKSPPKDQHSVKDETLATEIAETMNDRPLSPLEIAPQEEEEPRRSAEDSHADAYWNSQNDVDTAPPEEDEFYRSLSAAGMDAQRNSASFRHEEVATDQMELDAELERAQDQEEAFNRVIAERRARELELSEEGRALQNYQQAVAEGVADVEEDDLEAREAEAVAQREAALAERLRQEVEAENLETEDHQPGTQPQESQELQEPQQQQQELPQQQEPQQPSFDENDDFYGALASNTTSAPRIRSDSDVAPNELPAESAIDDRASTSSLHTQQLSVEGDAFYRSLSSGGPPRSPSARLRTEDFGEDRVNNDFDGIIGKAESIRGGSSSVTSSSPAPSDEFYARIRPEPQPAQPAIPPVTLNLELDDDFLEDDDNEELDEGAPETTSAQNSGVVENPVKSNVSLSFLESDDDLLPEDEEPDFGQLQQPTEVSPEVGHTVDAVTDPITAQSEEQPTPEPEPAELAAANQRLRPRPSMTQFHTDKQGFDLPLEILPQPVKRHAPQRVGSRVGTPQGPVPSPHGPPRPPAAVASQEPAKMPTSPPRAVPAPRPVPSRAPPRPQSGGASSKYRPSEPAIPAAGSAPLPHPASPSTGLAPHHDMFMSGGVPPQQPGWAPGAPPPGALQHGVPPPGSANSPYAPGPPNANVPHAVPAPRPVAPRPPANPDPYGFPGLQTQAGRRVSARTSNPGSRRVSGAGVPGAGVPGASSYRPGVNQGAVTPGMAAPPPSSRAPGPQPMVAAAPPASAPPASAAAAAAAAAAPPRGTAYAGGVTPTPGSPPDSISPRTVQRPQMAGAASALGARRAGSLSTPNAPPTAAPPISIQPDMSGTPQQHAHFGAPLRPPSVPQRADSRNRYTPSPLNVPVSLVNPPRGGHPEEELLNRQRELFVWAPRGWVQIVPENQFGASGASVHTGDIKSLEVLPQAAMAKFPLPVVNAKGPIKTKRKDLEKWIDSLISENRPGSLLYSVLKQLLGPDEGRDAGVRETLKKHCKLVYTAEHSGSAPISEAPSVPAPEILSMLRDGNREGAMQAALDARNYAHAFVIAHALGGAHWEMALNEFVAEEVRRKDPQLAFVYRALGAGDAASGAAALGELKPRGQTELVDYAQIDANLERWADAAAALYGSGGAAHAALAELGALLVDRGRVEEGHTCFVLVGAALGTPKFGLPLVGNNGSPGFDSYVLAELYEFVLGRPLPTLLPIKVAFAGLLADVGYEAEALRIAENAAALAKASKAPAKLSEQVARMVTRCSGATSTQGTWLQRKLSRPNLEKTWVSSFNKFVSGDDEEPQVPRPQSAGLATMPESIPQRQSYTPGPYPSRSESYHAGMTEAGPAGVDSGRVQTPLRPAPISEVNEEFGNGQVHSGAASPYTPQQHSQLVHQQQYISPEQQQQHSQQLSAGHTPYEFAYGQRPPSQGGYAPPVVPGPNGAYAPAVNGAYPPHAAQPAVGMNPDQFTPYQGPPHVPTQAPAAPAQAPYAPPATSQSPYAPQTPSQEGQYAPPVPQQEGVYAPQAPPQGGQYAPQAVPQRGQYAPRAPPSQGGPYSPQMVPHGGQYAPQAAEQVNSYAPQPEAHGGSYAPEASPAVQESVSQPEAPAPEAPPSEPKAEEAKSEPDPKKEEEQPKKKGWLSWLKKDDSNAQKPIKVKLGSEAKLIYDKDAKRWYREGDPKPEPKKGPPPPPKVASHTPVQGSPAPSQGAPSSLPAQPAPALATAPGQQQPSLGAAVPPGPAPGGAASPSAPSPPAAAGAPVPAPPVTGGIDGILAASASAGAARKKRPARSRYVNVTDSGLPEGMS